MVNERDVKKAFAKVRDERDRILFDLNTIKNRLEQQEKALTLNEDIKEQLSVLKRIELEKFVQKLDKEIDDINDFIKEMNKRTEFVNKVMNNFTHQMEVQQVQFEDMKKKIQETQKQAQNVTLDMKVLNEHNAEFEKLIEEKMSMEQGALRLEMQTGFAEQAVQLNKVSDKLDETLKLAEDEQEIIPEIFEQFAKIANEKIESEMRALRTEMKSQLSTVTKEMKEAHKSMKADTSTAVKEVKQELKEVAKAKPAVASTTTRVTTSSTPRKKPSQKKQTPKKQVAVKKTVTKKAPVKKTTPAPAKKRTTPRRAPAQSTKESEQDGAFRRAVRWLFVDEDEDETLKSVKKESLK